MRGEKMGSELRNLSVRGRGERHSLPFEPPEKFVKKVGER